MVVERKMQPLPPPEHRRVLRFVTFFALSLLAFSCWALVSSRINRAILIAADADKTPLLAGDHGTPIPAAVPASNDLRISDPAVRETPLAGGRGEGASEGSSSLSSSCDAENAQLRMYMYDLPPEFDFGMLGWDGKKKAAAAGAWPDVRDPGAVLHNPGGLNLQHSVAYWLTLDILSSTTAGIGRPCVAVRVANASQADVVFVPVGGAAPAMPRMALRFGEGPSGQVLATENGGGTRRSLEWFGRPEPNTLRPLMLYCLSLERIDPPP